MEETQEKVFCIDKNSSAYPRKLTILPDMPDKLYGIGTLPREDVPAAAIVGARMCSAYGRIEAFRYAKALSQAGVQIISGMALGIDSEGHKGALQGAAPTFAVLGCGPDVCYPARNRPLYHKILEAGGGILSEYPPGEKAQPWYFPIRNRIISALSDIVLVVEAKEQSGSLITAGCALEQGKPVYALPGMVSDPLSRGCHKLIYDGAGIAYDPEIILSELGISGGKQKKSDAKNKLGLESDLDLVYSCLDLRPKNLDYFIRKTGFPPGKTSSLLAELTLLGLAREEGRHYYVKQE